MEVAVRRRPARRARPRTGEAVRRCRARRVPPGPGRRSSGGAGLVRRARPRGAVPTGAGGAAARADRAGRAFAYTFGVRRQRVIAAMSGGVDSSVMAALLV